MSPTILEPEIEIVSRDGSIIGECPTWVPDEGALYWVDIKAPALYRLDPERGDRRTWPLPSHCGAFALLRGAGAAIVALREGLYRLDLRTGGLDRLASAPFDSRQFRFNEGIVDESGRFWLGVMFDPLDGDMSAHRRGRLHSYCAQEGLRAHDDVAEIHNGMVFTPDGRHLIVSHSEDGSITRYRLDLGNGRLDRPERLAEIAKEDGIPDGAAMDETGHYWAAIYDGGRLRRLTPEGAIDRDYRLPVSKPTMCCFAGPRLETLYVTSATEHLTADQRASEPLAGALLRFRPGIRGQAKPVYAR